MCTAGATMKEAERTRGVIVEALVCDGTARELAETAFAWVDRALLDSKFNMYHEFDSAVTDVELAVSVLPELMATSLTAHELQPLPDGFPVTDVVDCVKRVLSMKDDLRAYVEAIPLM